MTERTAHETGEAGAVVVAGMHRSGTSMVGGMLATLGVDMGRRLIPADPGKIGAACPPLFFCKVVSIGNSRG